MSGLHSICAWLWCRKEGVQRLLQEVPCLSAMGSINDTYWSACSRNSSCVSGIVSPCSGSHNAQQHLHIEHQMRDVFAQECNFTVQLPIREVYRSTVRCINGNPRPSMGHA